MSARSSDPSATRQPQLGLGKLLSEHRAPRSLAIVVWLTAPLMPVLAIGAFAGALDHDPREPMVVRVLLALVGLGLFALGLSLVLLLRRKRGTLVQLFEGGLVERVGSKRREVLWRDVQSFAVRENARYRFSEVKIELRAGGRLRLNSQHLQGLDAIVGRLEREVVSGSLPALRQSLEADERLSFGKVAVSRRGIHYRKCVFPWTGVAAAQVRLGFLEVLEHGAAAPTLRVNVRRLERVESLLALITEQRQLTPQEPPFVPSLDFRRVRRRVWLQGLIGGPLSALFLAFGGELLVRALRAFDAAPDMHGAGVEALFGWALLGTCLAVFLGLAGWHDITVRLRRHRMAERLCPTGKLVPVMVLDKVFEEWSFATGFRYRYLTPAGFEGTDQLEVGSGGAEPWRSGSPYLLALCSPDERESVLLSASGYPLARLPRTPDAD